MKTPHPAKFSDNILKFIAAYITPDMLVLDPFAGVGRLKEVHPSAVLNELEFEWAVQGKPALAIQGNALHLPFDNYVFDAIVTSCTYGNRMADHHHAKDGSKRHTYTHTIGRNLHADNSGVMQWGNEYRAFHLRAWEESTRVLRSGGLFILNVSDHIRDGEVVPVTDWHRDVLVETFDFHLLLHETIETPRQRHGANGNLRVPYESVMAFINSI